MRGRLRFTFKFLAGLVLAASIGLSFWRNFLRPYFEQRALIDQVRELGGAITTQACDVPWMCAVFGRDNLQDVITVELAGGPADDTLVPKLARLPRLQRLELDDTQITVAGFQQLIGTLDSAKVAFRTSWDAHSDRVQKVAFSPHGDCLASSSPDSTIALWRVADGAKLREFSGHKTDAYSLGFTTTGEGLVSASHDRALRLWDVVTGRMLERATHGVVAEQRPARVWRRRIPRPPMVGTGFLGREARTLLVLCTIRAYPR